MRDATPNGRRAALGAWRVLAYFSTVTYTLLLLAVPATETREGVKMTEFAAVVSGAARESRVTERAHFVSLCWPLRIAAVYSRMDTDSLLTRGVEIRPGPAGLTHCRLPAERWYGEKVGERPAG